MYDQRFDTAQTDGVFCQFQGGDKIFGGLKTAGVAHAAFEFHAQHAAAVLHLAFCQFVLRVTFQFGVVHSGDCGMGFQKFAQRQGVFALAGDAHGQGSQSAQEQEGVEGADVGAQNNGTFPDFFDRRAATADDASNQIAVPA